MDSILISLSLLAILRFSVVVTEDTEPPSATPSEDFRRTVIFIQKYTYFGQDVFLRGGIDHGQREGCTWDADTSACAIPIKHLIGGGNAKFNAWKEGDNYLDWYGDEENQGTFEDAKAAGTPMVWTTNDTKYSANVSEHGYGYTDLNIWGPHYWMVDLEMDCSKAKDGWFEVKGLLPPNQWEAYIKQDDICDEPLEEKTPYSTGNHLGRCGYLNMFTFDGNSCYIDDLE